jgi:nitrogen-specific signal transduction histidine kinase
MSQPVAGPSIADLRRALRITEDIPIIPCNAADKESVKQVLLALLNEALKALASAEADEDIAYNNG